MENAGLVTYASSLLLAKPDRRDDPLPPRLRERVRARDRAPVVRRLRDDRVVGRHLAERGLRDVDGARRSSTAGSRSGAGPSSARARARGAMDQDSLVTARRIRQPIAGERRHRERVRRDHVPEGRRRHRDVRGLGRRGGLPAGRPALPEGARLRQRDGRRLRRRRSRRPPKTPAVVPAFRTFLDQPGVPLVTAELACAGGAPKLLLCAEALPPDGLDRLDEGDLAGPGLRARGRPRNREGLHASHASRRASSLSRARARPAFSRTPGTATTASSTQAASSARCSRTAAAT